MKYLVTCQMDSLEAAYEVDAEKYYDAKMAGLKLFMEECRIPGTPSQYLSSRKGLIAVLVRSLSDSRKFKSDPNLALDFSVERIDSLRKTLRSSRLEESAKTECLGLLMKVRRVLDGQRVSSV